MALTILYILRHWMSHCLIIISLEKRNSCGFLLPALFIQLLSPAYNKLTVLFVIMIWGVCRQSKWKQYKLFPVSGAIQNNASVKLYRVIKLFHCDIFILCCQMESLVFFGCSANNIYFCLFLFHKKHVKINLKKYIFGSPL